jgi:superfamily II DNA/RNA helicase
VDKEANANGGMLVIATSIPDEREWIQWKGRTARQDRPGQFYVILDETAKPFSEPSRKKLKDELRKLSSAKGKGGESPDDQKIELMLEVADEGIDAKLKAFEMEQAQGEKLNELTEKYYAAHPRLFSDPWPFPEFKKTDAVLRRFLADWEQLKLTPAQIKQCAKDHPAYGLGIELD